MIFLIFSVSSITDYSYAYWASNVSQPANATTIGNINIADYLLHNYWNSKTKYKKNNIVYHNGEYWKARRDNRNIEPGTSTRYWRVTTP